VSSFGIGGTNASVILRSASEEKNLLADEKSSIRATDFLFVISAQTAERLTAYIKNTIHFLSANPEIDSDALAYTFQVAKEAMNHRVAIIYKTIPQLINLLQAVVPGKSTSDICSGIVISEDVQAESHPQFPFYMDDNVSRHQLLELAVKWVKAEWKMDWLKSYLKKKRVLWNVPVYPFAKEHHWIKQAVREKNHAPIPNKQEDNHLYTKSNSKEFKIKVNTSYLNATENGIMGYWPGLFIPEPATFFFGENRSTTSYEFENLFWPLSLKNDTNSGEVNVKLVSTGKRVLFEFGKKGEQLLIGEMNREIEKSASLNKLDPTFFKRSSFSTDEMNAINEKLIINQFIGFDLKKIYKNEQQCTGILEFSKPGTLIMQMEIINALWTIYSAILQSGNNCGVTGRPLFPYYLKKLSASGHLSSPLKFKILFNKNSCDMLLYDDEENERMIIHELKGLEQPITTSIY
jgi:hypothetical protein